MTDASITSTDYSIHNQAEFDDYFALLKPRVMSLVVFTASVGLFVAPNSVHPILAFASILFIIKFLSNLVLNFLFVTLNSYKWKTSFKSGLTGIIPAKSYPLIDLILLLKGNLKCIKVFESLSETMSSWFLLIYKPLNEVPSKIKRFIGN